MSFPDARRSGEREVPATEGSARPAGVPPRRFDQADGIQPRGVVCLCGRDFLTLTLEESCQPCPCVRRARFWVDEQADDDA